MQEIGLGKANKIDRLDIYWPTSNQRQTFADVSANQAIEITEGSTSYVVRPEKKSQPKETPAGN